MPRRGIAFEKYRRHHHHDPYPGPTIQTQTPANDQLRASEHRNSSRAWHRPPTIISRRRRGIGAGVCETVETAAAVQAAGEDRRLGKAHLKIQMGGMAAAVEAYRSAPTPNVIILETEGRNDILLGLDGSPPCATPAPG